MPAQNIDRHSPTELTETLHTEERALSPRRPAYDILDANPDQMADAGIVSEDLTNVPSEPSPVDAMEVDLTNEAPIHINESATPADMEETASLNSPEASEAAPPGEGQKLGRYLFVAL